MEQLHRVKGEKRKLTGKADNAIFFYSGPEIGMHGNPLNMDDGPAPIAHVDQIVTDNSYT